MKENSVAWLLQVAIFGKWEIPPEQLQWLCTCRAMWQSTGGSTSRWPQATRRVMGHAESAPPGATEQAVNSSKHVNQLIALIIACGMKNSLFREQIQAVKEEMYFHFNMCSSQGELIGTFCNDLNKTSISRARKHSVIFIICSGWL